MLRTFSFLETHWMAILFQVHCPIMLGSGQVQRGMPPNWRYKICRSQRVVQDQALSSVIRSLKKMVPIHSRGRLPYPLFRQGAQASECCYLSWAPGFEKLLINHIDVMFKIPLVTRIGVKVCDTQLLRGARWTKTCGQGGQSIWWSKAEGRLSPVFIKNSWDRRYIYIYIHAHVGSPCVRCLKRRGNPWRFLGGRMVDSKNRLDLKKSDSTFWKLSTSSGYEYMRI